MKKKILIGIIVVVLIIGSVVAFPFVRYRNDSKDTEEFYRENIATVGYENTIETAVPQTEIYNMIKNHFESPLPEGKTEKKAIVIGYDGCRADIVNLRKDDRSGISLMLDEGASMKLSYCGGVNYPAKNTQDTSTAPGWCSILTGTWADKHGVTANDITKSLEHKTLLTTLVEDNIIDSSVFITKWKGHFERENATYLLEKEYCEKNNLDVDFRLCQNDKSSNEYIINEVLAENYADFVFVIYEHTDSAGHNNGFSYNNPKYREAFELADRYCFATITAIKARSTYLTEDWLIILTSDHGGIGTEHGNESIQERMTFIVSNKEF